MAFQADSDGHKPTFYLLNHRRTFFAVFVAVVCLVLLIGVSIGYELFFRPMASHSSHTKTPSAPLIIVLDKTATASSFISGLYQQGLVEFPRTAILMIRLQGVSSRLKAGIYQIHDNESIMGFVSRVVSGDVLRFSLQVGEGKTKCQIDRVLEASPYLKYQPQDWDVVLNTDTMQQFLPSYEPIQRQQLEQMEGLLLANTYYYDAGSSASAVLLQANRQLKQELDDQWQHRATDVPYTTPYQLLVVASILEKEAASPEEKRLISGVIVNRLKKKMRLQMDPTVIYGQDKCYARRQPHDDLGTVSPYNTYRHHGLPPTPIAMVGKDALSAAAHPTMTNYLYFVARGDGMHDFSETYEEQRRAIARVKERKTGESN